MHIHLTPAVAALLGAGVTGTVTAITGITTQWATRSRERQQRVWDRRAGVYEDVLVVVRTQARQRDVIARKGVSPHEWTMGELSESQERVFVKVAIYGSHQLVEKYERSFRAEGGWVIAYFKWSGGRQVDGPVPSPGADPKWDLFLVKVEESKKVDQQLLDQIRRETLAVRPRRKWRRRDPR